MFDDVLHRIETTLDVPYPQRSHILRELEADLCACANHLREEGATEQEARDGALRDLGLDEEALASLSALHTPIIRRLLLRLPQPVREPAEWLAAGSSLIVGSYFIITEVPMLEIIREGGFAMYFILVIAGAALLLQARRAFGWFVSRDHSAASLARNTATPLYLAAATMLCGITGAAAGFRKTLYYVVENKMGSDIAMLGSAESLANIVFAGGLAFLIVLIQAALAAGLRALQVKTPVS
ncbi:MAG TPA: hypothetical protein VNM90_16425 [Haliangium sp.]|nr:hypothetical protein [Haliangium sp.]